jgi:hypothetical protein
MQQAPEFTWDRVLIWLGDHMKIKSALLGAALAGSMFVGGAAQATIVSFDDAPDFTFNPTSGGYNFTALGGFAITWSGNPYSDNGTQSLIYAFGSMEMTKVGGGAFGVSQLDSGLTWFTSETSLSVTVTGALAGGGTVSDSYTIGDGFQTYSFSNLNNVTSLTFTASPDGYVAIDNIHAVPEASTWVMMLAGFGALGFAGYRRNKTASIAA